MAAACACTRSADTGRRPAEPRVDAVLEDEHRAGMEQPGLLRRAAGRGCGAHRHELLRFLLPAAAEGARWAPTVPPPATPCSTSPGASDLLPYVVDLSRWLGPVPARATSHRGHGPPAARPAGLRADPALEPAHRTTVAAAGHRAMGGASSPRCRGCRWTRQGSADSSSSPSCPVCPVCDSAGPNASWSATRCRCTRTCCCASAGCPRRHPRPPGHARLRGLRLRLQRRLRPGAPGLWPGLRQHPDPFAGLRGLCRHAWSAGWSCVMACAIPTWSRSAAERAASCTQAGGLAGQRQHRHRLRPELCRPRPGDGRARCTSSAASTTRPAPAWRPTWSCAGTSSSMCRRRWTCCARSVAGTGPAAACARCISRTPCVSEWILRAIR